MKFDVLFLGADSSWAGLKQCRRRHEYFIREFARHPSVNRLYVVKRVTREHMFAKIWRGVWNGEKQPVDELFIAPVVPLSWKLPGTDYLNRFLARLQVKLQLNDNNLPAVSWCYWAKGYDLADYLKFTTPRIFDADHNIVDDGNQPLEALSNNRKVLSDCISEDVLVTAASRSMLNWLRERGHSHVAYLRNGIDLERFQISAPEPESLSSIPHPRIGYIGSLSTWIDYELLFNLAKRAPHLQFVIVGGWSRTDWPDRLNRLGNVHMMGRCPPSQVPAYLNAFDVGLGLYKTRPAWLDVDSMKLYEYLAAGLPVVTTPFHSKLREDFDQLIEVGGDSQELNKAIETILSKSDSDLSQWHARRQRFLRRSTWKERAQKAVQLCKRELHRSETL